MYSCHALSLQATPGRRRFLKTAALGTGAMLFGLARSDRAQAAGKTDALLLTCMDYRLMDDIERYMAGRGLRDRYDHVVLAGASLGAVTDRYPAWGQTFWQHLDIAIELHHIQQVIIIDHRDCGAYKVLLGEAHAADMATERGTHAAQLQELRRQLQQRKPALQVETLLMALDGSVDAVG
ncbi:MAG: hypothetical protein RL026_2551 [Pseudomonadota bacterium]|jgi:carbonic anhydrase